MSYVPPLVLIYQEFNTVPSAITDPLRAHISGPHAYLCRHAEPTEHDLGALGEYDPSVGQVSSWPGLPAGAIVDTDYTKLFVEGAKLQYFSDLIGAGDVVAPVANVANQVRIADATYGFASGNGYLRFPTLYDRDVHVGDQVHVRGVSGGLTYTLDSYVQGLVADPVASAISAASLDAGNATTSTAGTVVTQTAGVVNSNTLVADLTNYSSYTDGVVSGTTLRDTYTLEVIAASVGDDLSTATLRVTSASGLDDTLSIAAPDVDQFLTVGHRGFRFKFTSAGHSRASLSLDNLVVGQTWTVVATDVYKTVSATSGGTYTGPKNTTYVATVSRGGKFTDTLKPQITVTTTTGVDVGGPTTVSGFSAAVALGAYGVTLSFSAASGATGLRKGDRFYVPVTAVANGRLGTIVLGHSLPTPLAAATDLDLILYVQKDLEIASSRVGYEPVLNWSQSSTQITINTGMLAYDSSLTSDGVPYAVSVVSGNLFIEYRAWRQELTGDVGSVSDVGSLDAAIPGALSPDNPLKWGVYSALATSNGTDVKFTAVSDPSSLDAWSAVLALLVGRDDIYNLVPLTYSLAVQHLYAAHCDDQSSPEKGRERGAFFTLSGLAQKVVVSDATSTDKQLVLATIADDPASTGTQYTLLSAASGNAHFIANGVKPGDKVRYAFTAALDDESNADLLAEDGNALLTDAATGVDYVEYIVSRVVSEDQLLLVSGPPVAAGVAQKVEVWHALSRYEEATAIAAQAAAFGDRRIKAVWPDQILSGSVSLPGYYLCASLAGLRSGVVPHQGLTNLTIAGYDAVPRSSTYFNADQLNTLAASGVWIVTQLPTGQILTRQAVTTSTVDLNHSSEMVTTNLDSISKLLRARTTPFIGVTNVTPSAIALLHVELVSALEYLKANGYTDSLGSQVIDYTIVRLSQHALLKNRVVGVIDLTLPYEMDNIELHLVV